MSKEDKKRKRPPATTPEARQNQLIAMAMDLVEERLLDGTATSQEVTHFLKLGTTMENLEMEKKREEVKLLKAKTESIESGARMEELYERALSAMSAYQGNDVPEEDDDYEEL